MRVKRNTCLRCCGKMEIFQCETATVSCVGHAFGRVIRTHNNASAPTRIFSHEPFFSFASSKKNESRWERLSRHLHRVYSILMEIHLLPPRLHTASILSLVCLRSFLPLLQSVFVIFFIFFSFYFSFSFCPLAMSFVNFSLPSYNFYFTTNSS